MNIDVRAKVTKHTLLLTALTVLLTFAVQAKTDNNADLGPANANELYFANAVLPAEVRWLPLANGSFLALQREYLAAVKRGVAILLPELGTLPTAANGIEQLRIGLNDHGWTTISLMPPPRWAAPTGDNDKSVTPSYIERLMERLTSAQQAGKMIGGKLIIIAQGRQVSYLSKAYLDKIITMPDALILLDAQVLLSPPQAEEGTTAYPNTEHVLSDQISQLPLRVLDIYHLRSKLARQMAYRKKLSIKHKQHSYRQSELFDSGNNRQLVKTVYGWLKSSGLN